jgi:hypothetical protein
MADAAYTEPVTDSVPKVNNEVAVGADIEFQYRWWRFEKVLWWTFLALVVCDILGLFGRGFLANAKARSSDGSISIKYERIERFRTPSILEIKFSPEVPVNGQVKLWVSDELIKDLGNQRVVPQPLTSELLEDGILYTFPSGVHSDTVQFALEPSSSGKHQAKMHVPGRPGIAVDIWVVP